MAKTHEKLKVKNSIRTRLLSAILITSSAVTLVLTVIQLVNDYRLDLGYIQKSMKDIRLGRVDTLSHAVWNLDTSLIEAGLEGMLPIQDVLYAEISDKPDEDIPIGQAPYKKGNYVEENSIVFREQLFHIVDETEETPTMKAGSKIPIGELRVVFTKTMIFDRLQSKAILIMLTQAVKTFIVSFLILLYIQNIVTGHLSTIVAFLQRFQVGVRGDKLTLKRKVPHDSEAKKDELDLVADAINNMSEVVQKNHEEQILHQEELQNLNASLDRRVAEQTKSLADERNQMATLLHNMSQAVFRVGSDLKILGPTSDHCENIFGSGIVGKSISEVLFDGARMDEMQREQVKTSFQFMFGESPIQWRLSSNVFPKKIFLPALDKYLRVSYSPLFNEADELSEVLFVIEDVTLIEKLDRLRSEKEKKLELLQAFVSLNDEERYQAFAMMEDLLKQGSALLVKNPSEHLFGELYRVLHTLKGNCRMLQFNQIAQVVHHCESTLAGCLEGVRKGGLDRDCTAKLQADFELLHKEVVDASDLGAQMFNLPLPLSSLSKSSSDTNRVIAVLKKNFLGFRGLIEKTFDKIDNRNPSIRENVSSGLASLLNQDLSNLFKRLQPMVQELSSRSGNKVQLKIDDGGVTLPLEALNIISAAVVQTVRNSISHGIETPAERVAARKSEQGTISIQCRVLEHRNLEVIIQDDGRGINAEKVLKKARELGHFSAEDKPSVDEIYNAIFLPGLSTADEITDISGRGVGMDVISESVKALNGQLKLSSTPGQGTFLTVTLFKVLPPWFEVEATGQLAS